MLREMELDIPELPLPEDLRKFAEEGLSRSRDIDCFDFVPSNFQMVYRTLNSLPRGTWCEWGSGVGINTGIAAALGFRATGIEIDNRLAVASRELLESFDLAAEIIEGSYFDRHVPADYYYVYCWPGQMAAVEELFLKIAPQDAKLLICHGADDLRCKVVR